MGSGEWENHLVLELYDKGNVMLTDATTPIVTLLRNSKHDSDSRLTVGDAYPVTSSRRPRRSRARRSSRRCKPRMARPLQSS